MKPASAKAKGRVLAKLLKEEMLRCCPRLQEDDIYVTPSGVPGDDLKLSPTAKQVFPWNIECKNREKLNVWQAIRQAESHWNGDTVRPIPVVVIKKNHTEPFIVMPLKVYLCEKAALQRFLDSFSGINQRDGVDEAAAPLDRDLGGRSSD